MVSDIGTWVQLATVSTLLAGSGASNTAVALVYGALFIPQALCAPLGGVLADRYDRRVLFLKALSMQTAVTTVMAVSIALGERRPLVLGLMIFVQGASGSLGQPALSAVLPDLVPRDQLTAAGALNITAWNIGRVVGPVIAWALTWMGPAGRVGINAVSFAALWVAIFNLKRPFLPASKLRTSIADELRDGARVIVRARSCMLVIATMLVLHLTFIPFMGTIPIKAKSILAASEAQSLSRTTGLLMSAQGLGAVAGSLLIAQLLRRWRRSTVAMFASVAAVACSMLYATSASIVVALAFMALTGGSAAVLMGLFGGIVQRDAPPEHRGRILSWNSGVNGLSYGLGLLFIGQLADGIGIARALLTGNLILCGCLVAVLLGLPGWKALFDQGDARSFLQSPRRKVGRSSHEIHELSHVDVTTEALPQPLRPERQL